MVCGISTVAYPRLGRGVDRVVCVGMDGRRRRDYNLHVVHCVQTVAAFPSLLHCDVILEASASIIQVRHCIEYADPRTRAR